MKESDAEILAGRLKGVWIKFDTKKGLARSIIAAVGLWNIINITLWLLLGINCCRTLMSDMFVLSSFAFNIRNSLSKCLQ